MEDGVLFLLNCLDCILSDSAIDVFRLPFLNSRLLMDEYNMNMPLMEASGASKKKLDVVEAELINDLRADPVMAMILSRFEFGNIIQKLRDSNTTEATIKYLIRRINLDYYLDLALDGLTNAINESGSREQIEAYIRIALSSVLNGGLEGGVSRQYLQMIVRERLKNYETWKRSVDSIRERCDQLIGELFPESSSFVVTFGMMNDKSDMNDMLATTIHSILDVTEEDSSMSRAGSSLLDVNDVVDANSIISFSLRVKCCDPYRAAALAYILVSNIVEYYAFFSHTSLDCFLRNCIVENEGKGNVITADFRHESATLHSPAALNLDFASRVLDQSLRILVNRSSNTLQAMRLPNAIAMYSATIGLNRRLIFMVLWPALESFCGKADAIIEAVRHVLVRTYLSRVLDYLCYQLRRTLDRRFDELVERNEPNGAKEYLSKIIFESEWDDQRDELRNILGESSFCFYVLGGLHNDIINGKLQKRIHRYEKRVEWQLERLRRIRNTLIHAGNEPDYLIYAEPYLHEYFDVFIRTLMDKLFVENSREIDDAVYAMKLDYDNFSACLEDLKSLSESDWRWLVQIQQPGSHSL